MEMRSGVQEESRQRAQRLQHDQCGLTRFGSWLIGLLDPATKPLAERRLGAHPASVGEDPDNDKTRRQHQGWRPPYTPALVNSP